MQDTVKPTGTNDYKLVLLLVVAWHWAGDKQLPKPILTEICKSYDIIRPQWLNESKL